MSQVVRPRSAFRPEEAHSPAMMAAPLPPPSHVTHNLPRPLVSSAGPCPHSVCNARCPITRLRRAPTSPCQLRSLTLPVAELGLGYSSEEKVVFSYCTGSCLHSARTQHGLTLARLQRQGRAHGGPCCRPTRYADVAFLDDHHRWQRLVQLSAAACGCSD
ncbi:PREDICTED: persephin [Elephantulus edwardii]|uniref:persephin n=1 Tax=Elephantulus edwardii TaxID=28737 RepID=UPI0003F0E62E|nr:PREDICTED: persephin [Elephantulus edwardii]